MTTRTEMIDLLEELVSKDRDLLETIIQEYVLNMSESKFVELEDFIVNHFGED
jgi:hypothetical protein